MLNLSQPVPLSLYIHYPWCVKKCPYCDFNSHQQGDTQTNSLYLAALIADLVAELPAIWGRTIESIFIGGGTPSLMPVEMLDELMSQLRALLNLSPNIEITLEANPGTIDFVKFAEFKQLGINRLSIGIQSFDEGILKALGRIHSAKEAIHAVEMAHQAGFENINQDLMFALPGQSLAQAKADISQALSLQTQHLSYYQLTIEPNTLFASQTPVLPNDDLSYAIQEQGHELLAAQGFEQYEISAWSSPQRQCQHNLNYWQFGDYLGIGAGAHGKITQVSEQSIYRNWKLKQPDQYMHAEQGNVLENVFIGGQHKVTEADLVFEFMLNSSRLTQGIKPEVFYQNTGLAMTKLQPLLDKAIERGLLIDDKSIICPTKRGFQYLNELQEMFLE